MRRRTNKANRRRRRSPRTSRPEPVRSAWAPSKQPALSCNQSSLRRPQGLLAAKAPIVRGSISRALTVTLGARRTSGRAQMEKALTTRFVLRSLRTRKTIWCRTPRIAPSFTLARVWVTTGAGSPTPWTARLPPDSTSNSESATTSSRCQGAELKAKEAPGCFVNSTTSGRRSRPDTRKRPSTSTCPRSDSSRPSSKSKDRLST